MGLDTTHDAWHGPYSSFNEWREALCEALGFDLRSMRGFGGDGDWEPIKLRDGFIVDLLNHSDCDGSISWSACFHIAKKLLEIYPKIHDDVGAFGNGWATIRFAAGCLNAFNAQEDIEFH